MNPQKPRIYNNDNVDHQKYEIEFNRDGHAILLD